MSGCAVAAPLVGAELAAPAHPPILLDRFAAFYPEAPDFVASG